MYTLLLSDVMSSLGKCCDWGWVVDDIVELRQNVVIATAMATATETAIECAIGSKVAGATM